MAVRWRQSKIYTTELFLSFLNVLEGTCGLEIDIKLGSQNFYSKNIIREMASKLHISL